MYLSQPEIKTYQLVNDYVKLEDSFKDRVLDTDGVFEKFGVLKPDYRLLNPYG